MSAEILARAREILQRLVAFDTVSDRSNLRADRLRRGLSRRPRRRDLARARTRRATRRRCWRRSARAVDGGVVLSGHTDVVPVEGQPWTGDPFVLREADGRLYGRGACDMKGFDAVVLAMVPEFLGAPG